MATAKPGTVNTVSTPAQSAMLGAMQTSTPSILPAPKSSFNLATTPVPTTMSSLTTNPLSMGSVQKVSNFAPGTTPLGTTIPKTGLASNVIQKNIGTTTPTPTYDQLYANDISKQNTPPVIPTNNTQTPPAPAAPVIANPQTQGAAINPDFTGLIGGATQAAQGNTAIGQSAADIAKKYGQEIADVGGQGARFEAGQLTTGTSPVAEGNAAVTAQTVAAQKQALASGESAALQGTGQQLTAQQQEQNGLNTTAGLVQPSTAQYGQTVFDPLTQSFKSTGGGNLDPQTLASQLAPLVASGQMTIDAANAQMTGGAAGTTALRQAILAKNPNFNFNLSTASGATQQQGQALQTQSNTVNDALDTLGGFYDKLASYQKAGIPLTNDIAQTIGQFLGSGEVSQFNNALTDTRAQIQGILGSVGITPTESGNIVNQYLPAGMTPDQLKSNTAALKTLIQQKVDNFKASGQQNSASNSSSSSGGLYDF